MVLYLLVCYLLVCCLFCCWLWCGVWGYAGCGGVGWGAGWVFRHAGGCVFFCGFWGLLFVLICVLVLFRVSYFLAAAERVVLLCGDCELVWWWFENSRVCLYYFFG